MSTSSILSNIERYKRELNDLSKKIAEKRKRYADREARANRASSDASKSQTPSTIKSKIAEAERYRKESTKYSNEIALLESRRAIKEKQIIAEESKFTKAQIDEQKKRDRDNKRLFEHNNKQILNLTKTVLDIEIEQSKLKEIYPLLTVSSAEAYDVFISHASEDKGTFVDALVEELTKRNVKVWYDRNVLTWGKSIRQNIDAGLRKSKFAIVVLSEHYIQKYWTQKEFNALFALGSQLGDFILPIWHNITPERAREFSPMLCDSIALVSSEHTQAEIADLFVEKLNYDNNG